MSYDRIVGRVQVSTHAVRDVSFDVRPREFVSLIGPSGCGKSTVLRIAAGLQRPTGGALSIAGEDVDGPGTDRAMVFQQPGLLPWRTVLDNVGLPLELAGMEKAKRRAHAASYVDLVGLSSFAEHYPRELSGGMQQRVGLARALAVEPKVLLMDEPFGALDAISRERMQEELLRIWESMKTTVIFVTHAIDEAVLLSDRVLVMGRGAILHEVDIDLERPRSRAGLLTDERTLALMRTLEQHLADAEGGPSA
jgi:NitT/TauT family transport system ATP-binding protein